MEVGTPTGKMRYRHKPRMFKHSLVVVQVEVKFEDGPDDHNGMPEWLAGVKWRDARPDDFMRGIKYQLIGG